MAADVILASGSAARAGLLRRQGLPFRIIRSDVDETSLKNSLSGSGSDALAVALAKAKAEVVSRRFAQAVVIGGDQILDCQGSLLDKPADRAQAADQLLYLSGKTHQLISAAAVFQGGDLLWQGHQSATLTMRVFDRAFVEDYLDRAGDAVLSSVGGYQIETLGKILFSDIQGDQAVIMGLPLDPLMDFLRSLGLGSS